MWPVELTDGGGKKPNQTTARKHGTLWYIKYALDQTLQGLRVLKKLKVIMKTRKVILLCELVELVWKLTLNKLK